MTATQAILAESATTRPSAIARGRSKVPSVVRKAIPWIVAASLIAGGGGAVLRYRALHPEALVLYESAAVDRGPLAAKVTATGQVSALVTVQVGSQVSGRIETISVDFESAVKKGQTIATIEPTLFRAAVAQARANHASAQAAVETARAHQVLADKNLIRDEALNSEGLLSKADLDAAEAAVGAAVAEKAAATAGVGQAKAALDQVEQNLRYTTIVSPIDGIVISRNVDVGQTVAAALQAPTLFTIAEDLTHMQIDTNVAEADIGKIKAGMPVTFTVDAYPGRVMRGTVRQVRENAQTIQNVVTYDAVIDVDNTARLLKPGMTASVSFIYATRERATRLPNAALRFKPDPATLALAGVARTAQKNALIPNEHVLWVLSGNTMIPRSVRTGISDGSASEVLAGDVHAGDRVVVETTTSARSGTRR